MLRSSAILFFRYYFFVIGSVLCISEPRVIIIGAGASGIAAASKLLENGINDVKIFEAESRIGGRIRSVEFGNTFVELGAQWCHGEHNNIVFDLVKDLDLLESTDTSVNFCYSSLQKPDSDFIQELNEILDNIYFNITADEGISMGDYIIQEFNSKISEAGYDLNQKKIAQEFLNTYKNKVLAWEGSFSWFRPSAVSDFEICDGDQNLNWKGKGYHIILKILMKQYPYTSKGLPIQQKIVLDKEVVQIEYDQEEVIISCLDEAKYFADHVIFTPSVGVLKRRHVELFHPPLPQEKIDAIEEFGLDAVMKVYMYFTHAVFASKNVAFCWTDEERLNLINEFSLGPIEDGHSWLENFVSVLNVENNPKVIVAWFVGEFVPQIELLSDDILTDGIMFILNKFLGSTFNNTTPAKILRSKWYSNPHFRGSYSYETVASRKRNVSAQDTLSQPLIGLNQYPVLLFAGESTNQLHYGTVHGAIESGFREAERIINIYR